MTSVRHRPRRRPWHWNELLRFPDAVPCSGDSVSADPWFADASVDSWSSISPWPADAGDLVGDPVPSHPWPADAADTSRASEPSRLADDLADAGDPVSAHPVLAFVAQHSGVGVPSRLIAIHIDKRGIDGYFKPKG